MQSILLAPHNDDEVLFASYIIMKYKPLVLVVTDSFIQGDRGDPVTWQQRRRESAEALKVLGAEVEFGGIPDKDLTPDSLKDLLEYYTGWRVFAPVVEGGHPHHDMIGSVARKLFRNVVGYRTYQKNNLRSVGEFKCPINEEQMQLKKKALLKYNSQIELGTTKPYFFTDNQEYIDL